MIWRNTCLFFCDNKNALIGTDQAWIHEENVKYMLSFSNLTWQADCQWESLLYL